MLDPGVDPDERIQVGPIEGQTWSAGGPQFQALVLNSINIARLLLDRGADQTANVRTSGSPAYGPYDRRHPEMIALLEQHGDRIAPGSAGYARHTEIGRKMMAGASDPHLDPNHFSARTVAEEFLWGGVDAPYSENVRMALEHVDWPPDDPRAFWMPWRPLPVHEDDDAQQQAACCECFQLILARCGPHHRTDDYGQILLHETVSRDHWVGIKLTTILLGAAPVWTSETPFSKAPHSDGPPVGVASKW